MTRPSHSAVEITVFGIVQGVGFRPFIYRLARDLNYSGWVKNIGFGVRIHLEQKGNTNFADFVERLNRDKPPLSQIDNISTSLAQFSDIKDFTIEKTTEGKSFVFISPDISVCDNCYREMKTTSDRRYEYPFINCTDCGPRYTIVKSLPYDREQTTMQTFQMCENCRKEYLDPLDRRYHAQPIACPECGPQVELINTRTRKAVPDPIPSAVRLILEGKILAVKGLGGFHLVCSPFQAKAVQLLRKIKSRRTKPMALMAKTMKHIRNYAFVNKAEQKMLESVKRPIVLLKKKKDMEGIAPNLNELGFMLPYTPLHFLLLEELDILVATSSNKKDSPIIRDEDEGIYELCDHILTHNRPIHMRADDSVMKVVKGQPLFLRRARGYVPYPQKVQDELVGNDHILALGGELKDTLSLYKNGYVITSQFLGDLDEYQNYRYFEETLQHLKSLFQVQPSCVVTDLHPDFHTTRYAAKTGLPHIQVQHHYAHVLAPLLEHNFPTEKKALGVALDGFGYGDDGHAWGGEFLLFDYSEYLRFAHFQYVPLPGGDLASKQPWRMALAYLRNTFGDKWPRISALNEIPDNRIKGVMEMMDRNINSPLSSSCGRLFDAVSFLCGIAPGEMEFEAEAPMRLESAADPECRETYDFSIHGDNPPYKVSFRKTIRSLLTDVNNDVPVPIISAKFHNTLSRIILVIAESARKIYQIDTVVLGGGVFLNRLLLETTTRMLESSRFKILRPVLYSPNDESISLGQIAHALAIIKQQK